MQFDVPVHCLHKVPFFNLRHVLVPVHIKIREKLSNISNCITIISMSLKNSIFKVIIIIYVYNSL